MTLGRLGVKASGVGRRHEVSTAVETSAAARKAPTSWDGRDGAIAWATYSQYPGEAGIAGRRFAQFMDRLPLPALWYAVAEAALEGHHAAGALIEPYLRSRCARIGESLREIQRLEERSAEPSAHRKTSLKRLDVDALLRRLA